MCTYAYIYVYICREREREKRRFEGKNALSNMTKACVFVRVYM